ncbi:MAG: hypothetical protein ACXVAP_07480 [Candidatus Limnocylindrales bacterium]
MTPQPEPAVPADHTRHDPLLLASLASGDPLSDGQHEQVEIQLACPACQATFADLVALTGSLQADLPTPRRSRDFRLTPEAARRDRRTPWLSWLRPLPSSRLQPLAAAVCSIGLLMVLVGVSLPGGASQAIQAPAGAGASGASLERNAQSGGGTDTVAGAPGAGSSGAPAAGSTAAPNPSEGPAFAAASPKSSDLGSPLPEPGVGRASLPPGAEGGLGPSVAPPSDGSGSAMQPPAGPLIVGGTALFLGGLVVLVAAHRRRAARSS